MWIEVLSSIVVLYICLRLWYENYTKPWRDFEQVPLPRYTLLGHFPSLIQMTNPELFRNIHIWLENSERDSILVWAACRPYLFTRNQLLFENVVSIDKYNLKSESYWILEDWVGKAIILAEGQSWRKRRKLLTPSFHFNILQDSVKTMEKHSLELVDALKTLAETGKTFNAFKVMKMYTIGIISETAMGIESNVVKTVIEEDTKNVTEDDQKLLNMIFSTDRLVQTLISRDKIPLYWYKPLFKLFPTGSQYYSDLKKIKSFAMTIIEKRIEELEKAEGSENINTTSKCNYCNSSDKMSNSTKKNSMNGSESKIATSTYHKKGTIFIDTMLSLYKDGEINVEDILNETQTFIFAGYHSVATAFSWSLYLLGRNKIQQDKAHEEAMRVKALNLPIIESIREMHYIECVIKEVLRIHPPSGLIGRKFERDSYFGAKHYPQGTNMMLCINEIQRDPKNYKDPMVFKPERFFYVENDVKINENRHYTFVPFSAGPRNCIGQKFAMLELKITLFYLLSEYEVIATQKEEDLIETFDIIHSVENENGLEIKLKER